MLTVNLKLKGEIHQVRSYHTSKMNLVTFTINSNEFYHQFSKVSFFISTYIINLFPHTKNHKQTIFAINDKRPPWITPR